jgi:tripartite-type tricarboxylate transporter receptor subunit TctC
VLVVNRDVPAATIADFVAYVQGRPRQLAYAEAGIGSISHLAMALFLKRAGLDMTGVTYRGNAPALTDVIAGHVPAMFSLLGDALPHAASGSIHMLAVSSRMRAQQVPTVPTLSESGYPGYQAIAWNGLMAPAATPKDIVTRLASEVSRAVKDPKFAERLASFGVDPLGNDPDELAAMIAVEIPLWSEAVKIAGVTSQ